MNYARFVGIAHVTAAACATIAAIGATVGFYALAGSWVVALLIGAGTAAVLGLGWYGLLGAAASTRRALNLGLIFVAGIGLTSIALAVSGWSLATALGGVTAHRIHQQEQIANHDLALQEAFGRLAEQEPLLDAVTIAQAVYGGYVTDETARGGCGPKCRTYQSMSDSLTQVRANLEAQTDEADNHRKAAEAALAQARQGRDIEGNLAIVSSAVAFLNGVDLDAGQVGLVQYTVGSEGVSNVATDDLTQAIVAADAEKPEAVVVPVYERISAAEATLRHRGRIAGAWAAAIGIDCGPLLMLLLVIALWREPLLRGENRAPISDEDIRAREGLITGSNVKVLR